MDFESLKFASSVISAVTETFSPVINLAKSFAKDPCETKPLIEPENLKQKAEEMLQRSGAKGKNGRPYRITLFSESTIIPQAVIKNSPAAQIFDGKTCTLALNDADSFQYPGQESTLLTVLFHEKSHCDNEHSQKEKDWINKHFPKIVLKGKALEDFRRIYFALINSKVEGETIKKVLQTQKKFPQFNERDLINLENFRKDYLKLIRSQEHEADIGSIIAITQAGYDPANAICYLKEVQTAEEYTKANTSQTVAKEEDISHPSAQKRIEKLQEIYPALSLLYSLRTLFGS